MKSGHISSSQITIFPSYKEQWLINVVSFNRKVLQQIKLSDGNILPAGTFISMPTYSIARDADFYPSPLEFQPLRFYDLRQRSPEDANRHQLTSTSPTNLAFGYGQSSCPGRAFGALEMKLILGRLLHEYDFEFPHGQLERPENVYMDERICPSKEQKIVFKKRAVARTH
jgi:cytochrome P450